MKYESVANDIREEESESMDIADELAIFTGGNTPLIREPQIVVEDPCNSSLEH